MDKFIKKKQVRVCAFILAVLFGVMSVCSCAVIYLAQRSLMYRSDSFEEVLKENQKYLQTIYSYQLVYAANNKNSEQAVNLKDSNLLYFVKKDGEAFLSNCSEDELEGAYEVTIDDGDIWYSGIGDYFGDNRDNLINVLTREYNFFIDNSVTHERSLKIKEIIYSKEDDRFYLNFGDLVIPMDEVAFSYDSDDEEGEDVYSGRYFYDKDKKCYYTDENAEIEDDSGRIWKQKQEKFEISKISDWNNMFFYVFDFYEGLNCGVDDIVIRDSLGGLKSIVDAKADITGIYNAENMASDDYRWNNCYIGVSSPNITPDQKKYLVLTKVKAFEDMDEQTDDMFYQLEKVMSFLYSTRYQNIGMAIFSGLLFIVMLYIYLWSVIAADSSREKKKNILNRCPLEIYILVAGFIIVMSVVSIASFIDSLPRVSNVYITDIARLCVLLTACIFIIWTMFIGELFGRKKDKVLLKNTLTGMAFSFVKKECAKASDAIHENINFFIRMGILFVVIFFVELSVIMATENDLGVEIIIWLVCKVIEVPIFFKITVDLKALQNKAKSICDGNVGEKLETSKMFWELKRHGAYLNKIDEGVDIAVQKQMKSERMRTELITNVSHDIKTPLTSIINYVDLLSKEGVGEEDRAQYLEVLNRKSAELKKLIEDLIEASKASTGNISVDLQKCDVGVLMVQVLGEFEEKLNGNNLQLITKDNISPANIMADRQHLWRVFDNLMNNICKYSQSGTRVYVDVETGMEKVCIIFRNTSKYPLNISGSELLERFVRGDSSRHTEGNGLGLAIAQSLTELMNGKLTITVDGDLFKATLEFPIIGETEGVTEIDGEIE